MTKTCIICGNNAGSGEHVFPASLGGRRTNKGIYCSIHDYGYSSLVSELAKQLELFNFKLGVRNDHTNKVRSVTSKDTHSGREVRFSESSTSFVTPQVLSETKVSAGKEVAMAFPDMESLRTWIAQQEAHGLTVTQLGGPQKKTFYLGESHFKLVFGGAHGLAAVGYIGQTFLAQEFPDLARSASMTDFKGYTQDEAHAAAHNLPSPPLSTYNVWWDFNPSAGLPPNAYDFGHRIVVGVDSKEGVIYGYLSFFLTLNFAMIFGTTGAAVPTRAVIIDIDPQASHPPKDITKTAQSKAVARVDRPLLQTAGLATAIDSGQAQAQLRDLVGRLEEHELRRAASEISAELNGAEALSTPDREALFSRILESRLQRLLNLGVFVNSCG